MRAQSQRPTGNISARQHLSPGRRAAAYWFADGLPHTVLGLAVFLTAALGLLVWCIFAPDPQLFHGLILAAGFILFAFTGRKILDRLKSRITYPRTGYAQSPEEIGYSIEESLTSLHLQPGSPPKENVTSFERRTGMVIFFALIVPWDGSPRWFVPALMAALAALLYWFNRNTEHAYRWWSVGALPLMGLVFLWAPVPPLAWDWLPLLLVGGWLVALGAFTLLHYLRMNQHSQTLEGVRA